MNDIPCMGHVFGDPNLVCKRQHWVSSKRVKRSVQINRRVMDREGKDEAPRYEMRRTVENEYDGEPCGKSWFDHQRAPTRCPHEGKQPESSAGEGEGG